MKNIAENNLIRFINISKKKEGIFATYKVKGIRGGAAFSATITVDTSAAGIDPTHTLEQIIEKCAVVAVREYKKAELQFEGVQSI